jgi:hypothetical protein
MHGASGYRGYAYAKDGCMVVVYGIVAAAQYGCTVGVYGVAQPTRYKAVLKPAVNGVLLPTGYYAKASPGIYKVLLARTYKRVAGQCLIVECGRGAGTTTAAYKGVYALCYVAAATTYGMFDGVALGYRSPAFVLCLHGCIVGIGYCHVFMAKM